ncbi:MAG: M23 family metallopeptidase [Clostridia bacterium]|nr:M23 family metallopeptidase [Clostridia bacterium]
MAKKKKYIITYKNWLPYARSADRRGFISKRYGGGHTGIDSVCNCTENPVCAVMDGVVTGVYKTSLLGNVVEYTAGRVLIAHYHLAKVSVRTGDRVTAGQTILGIEGSTGSLSNGKHLHTSMYVDGVLVDPEPYLSGQRSFDEFKEEITMAARKVIRDDLNLRTGAGTQYPSLGCIPVGMLINPTEVIYIGAVAWGKHTCILSDGQPHTGWSNLGDTWSEPYGGALMPYKPDDGAADKLAAAEKQITALQEKIDAVKAAIE